MQRKKNGICILLILLPLQFSLRGAEKKIDKPRGEESEAESAVMWRDPADIASRNLFYGPGGRKHVPHGTFRFVKEDLDGTNPKFEVVDQDGVKWKVKLGVEARPETVASRIVWAVGYRTNEDYFLKDLNVTGMPSHVRRLQGVVDADGSVHNVRLKRMSKTEKKIGTWKWRDDPFLGTRELSGLKVMMALINNWDLKDENNAVYREDSQRVFLVSDLGASFGTAGRDWTRTKSKDNLQSYSHSKFIRKVTPEYVDFQSPARPRWIYLVNPKEYFSRLSLESIGRNIPRQDAKWIGGLLARLSRKQIRDAFRASGYSPEEVEAFSTVIERRIAMLTAL